MVIDQEVVEVKEDEVKVVVEVEKKEVVEWEGQEVKVDLGGLGEQEGERVRRRRRSKW